ncbi:MAG: thioredoxin domain-containing protein [Rhodothermia bacterium]|nr:MAG: thioredoxin domain-containing protein [Rhodothermia bacterium]
MANRLKGATSPYLRQHVDNPVDWYSWGDDAFNDAASRGVPVLISIGYAACHWCHVMAHESFEDPEVGEVLNRTFVSIKVDREEHPTVDHFYMSACTAMGHPGGWPLTIVATPDRRPFYCSTYLPKTSRHGRVGLLELVERVSEVWKSDSERVTQYANDLVEALRQQSDDSGPTSAPDERLAEAFSALVSRYDKEWGGFGAAPKFPTAHQLSFLLRYGKRMGDDAAYRMVDATIRAMRKGGVFDQIGLGIHRYSTDREWKLPHFEKMLVDQALLVIACTEAFQVKHDRHHQSTAEDIIAYVLRDMSAPDGAFYASEDADSEGSEGKFYLWAWDELQELLTTEELEYANREWNVERAGNIDDEATGEPTGMNLFFGGNAHGDGEYGALWSSIVQKLLEARSNRIRPQRDEKLLTDWNGLMIAALTKSGRVFSNTDWIQSAEGAAHALLEVHEHQGKLAHSSFEGIVSEAGFLDDYAYLSWGLLELFEATGKVEWLSKAEEIVRVVISDFWDEDANGFFISNPDVHKLPLRQKQYHDGATPAGGSIAAQTILKLADVFADAHFEDVGRAQAEVSSAASTSYALGYFSAMMTADLAHGARREIVIVGKAGELSRIVNRTFLPNAVILHKSQEKTDEIDFRLPNLAEYVTIDGKETVYICTNRSCEAPITEADALKLALKD